MARLFVRFTGGSPDQASEAESQFYSQAANVPGVALSYRDELPPGAIVRRRISAPVPGIPSISLTDVAAVAQIVGLAFTVWASLRARSQGRRRTDSGTLRIICADPPITLEVALDSATGKEQLMERVIAALGDILNPMGRNRQ